MAKRRKCVKTEADTKKPKQVLIAESRGAKTRRKKKDPENDTAEEEEKLERKVNPKPRLSSKRAAQNKSSSTTNTSTDGKTIKESAKKPEEEEKKMEDDDDDSEDEWEEVEELAGPLGPVEPPEPVLPSQPVEIEIETAEVKKQKKRQAEFETYLRRMMKRYKKDLLIDTHKVHLLCLLANGMFRNKLCSEPDLLAVAMSLLPPHFCKVAKERIDQNYLSGLLKWFRATITLNPSLPTEERPDPRALLERRLGSLSARDHQEMTHLFLLFLRSLQLFCRLVLSLHPVPFKPPSAKSKGPKASTGATERCQTNQESSKTNSPETKVSPGTKRPAGGGKIKGGSGGKKAKRKEMKEGEEGKPVSSGGQRPKNTKRRSIASKVNYKEESNSEGSEEEEISDAEEIQETSDDDSEDSETTTKSAKKKMRNRKSTAKTTKTQNTAAPKRRSSGGKQQVKDEDSEWEEGKEEDQDEDVTNNRTKRRSGRKKEGPGADEWLEVYLDKTSSWVCVDVEQGVGVPHLCSQSATAPLTYVVAVDGDGFLKDLGKKYDPTWMTSSQKRRVDDEWWEETLESFMGPEDDRNKKEEKEGWKESDISVFFLIRDCVHTLHSRDIWLKQARTVRLGEEPYKMVKGFSNRSRKARMISKMREEKDLPLFGEWQTEEYQPPVAVDGKVPRNDYGNVYLFKACMIPVGCVHLRLPNLHRVAKKLSLDVAPAVTGFDYHGGYSHAVTDGYIVCEEDEEVLRAAWVEEQEIQKQKEKEKKEKRAIASWTLLVKGLLIRERLKQRYNQKNQGLGTLVHGEEAGGFSSDEEGGELDPCGAKTASETLALSWPQNRQEEEDRSPDKQKKTTTKREKKGQEKHLFPFEKV
ncbi:hypothetical protein ILYODFUR_001893 [Ilyodon furcidens]|uniref:Xeroderma pigmentosum, complementation group C n=1 Tax=Ilyodon furcidens TaxID=33524 RepID=A0ABV0U3S2_9TELE